MRINQFVASSSKMSRRAADTAIAAGRVKVGGHTATLGQTVATQDVVTLDGSTLTPATHHTYIALHKPAGYISSHARQGNDPTLYELLPENLQSLRLTGRLDRDSSGLVLLSDDGSFVQNLSHPSRRKTKQYELTLTKPLAESDQAKLEAGVKLRDGLSTVTIVACAGRTVTLTIGEGRNRQLRRTFGALGYTVERLHRTRIGHYELGSLPSGSWQHIAPGDTA
jgi:23S rRNA pseudouridine2605 synthase